MMNDFEQIKLGLMKAGNDIGWGLFYVAIAIVIHGC